MVEENDEEDIDVLILIEERGGINNGDEGMRKGEKGTAEEELNKGKSS